MRALAWIFVGFSLVSCCATERIILLPDASGKVGKLAVQHGAQETVLDAAYSAATVAGNAVERGQLSKDRVQREFGAQLAGLPPRPVSYMLYFLPASDELTEESQKHAAVILDEIAKRPAADVLVIGHTDRVGNLEDNDRLSLERAQVIREKLIALGIDAARLKFQGRGERELLVATDDGVDEPKNRRVEINVR